MTRLATLLAAVTTIGFLAGMTLPCVALPRAAAVLAPACMLAGSRVGGGS